MDNFIKKNHFKILFTINILVLFIAYFIQYVLGYQPCSLCLIERVPYKLAIIILILCYIFKKDQIFYGILLAQVFAFSFLISLYHLGIEQGIINESSLCSSKNIDLTTKEDILNSLEKLRISCKDVAFRVFGFSLTTYNVLISFFMFITSIKIFLVNNGIKK